MTRQGDKVARCVVLESEPRVPLYTAKCTRGGVLVRRAAAGGVLGAVGRDDDDEAAREWRAWRRWPIS